MRLLDLLQKRGSHFDTQLAKLVSQVAYRCYAMMPRDVEDQARKMRAAGALGYLRARVGELAREELDQAIHAAAGDFVIPQETREGLLTRVLHELVLHQRKTPHTKLVTRRITRPREAA